MSHSSGHKHSSDSGASKRYGKLWLAVGVAVAILALLSITTCNPSLPDPLPTVPAGGTNAAPTAAPGAGAAPAAPGSSGAAVGAAPVAWGGLVGRWQRPDGGYVLQIDEVAADGRLKAGYFNPRPIHVQKAEAANADAGVRVFVELRDEGYPGSTYTLAYLRDRDMLVGKYYQAALGQEFDVVFARLPQ